MIAMTRVVRIAGMAGLLLTLAGRAEAGPPLLCSLFEPGAEAHLLPWGNTSNGWKTPDPAYDRRRLVADTLNLLSAHAPVLARMENLRRATLYASEDPRLAAALLSALTARTRDPRGGNASDPLAWFDAGYLIESYRQGTHIAKWDMLSGDARRTWTLISEPAQDGYAMVRKAIALAGRMPAMEYAASLMTTGATAARHRQRATSAAPVDVTLARHLAR